MTTEDEGYKFTPEGMAWVSSECRHLACDGCGAEPGQDCPQPFPCEERRSALWELVRAEVEAEQHGRDRLVSCIVLTTGLVALAALIWMAVRYGSS